VTSVLPDRRAQRSDSDTCAGIVRAHARTFSLAAGLLPPAKQRGAFALYAFCRQADDIVDRAPVHGTAAEDALTAHREHLRATLAGRAREPVFRELAWTIDRFGVPAAPLEELLDGVARDLEPPRIADDAALRGYCESVAGSVGEMCTYVFGVRNAAGARTRAVGFARVLGVAMQLTNILRCKPARTSA
jgi:phytoene synthase